MLTTTLGPPPDRLEDNGIIERVECSDWASPTVIIPKEKDGKPSVRICGDYKLMNLKIDDDKYPLPTAQDLLSKLAHNANTPKVFSILDLRGAYNQLMVSAESAGLMTLNTHKGLYRTSRLAYGVKTAPSTFQFVIDQILSGNEGVCCFVDDMVAFSETKEQHIELLEIFFSRLEKYNCKLQKIKCRPKLMQNAVKFVGHNVSEFGIKPVHAEVEAIQKAPPPTNITELQSFLGMVQYYSKNCASYVYSTAPVTCAFACRFNMGLDNRVQ